MSTCIDCYGTNSITPCATVGCKTTNYAKCITYSGAPLTCATGAVKTFNIAGTAVNPAVITDYTVSPTGGTGNSLSVKVTRTPGSTAYTVTLVTAGSGYTLNDLVTVVGASIGGSTPANNLTLSITALVPLIAVGDNLDLVISNLNARLCASTSSGLSYSGFSYGCLRVGGNLNSIGSSITTAQQFTEATAAALCSLNTRVISVETPTFTVPGCVTGITSGSSTLGQVLTAYGTKLCTTTTSIDMTGVTNNPCIAYAFTTKPSTTVVSDYINWITTNVCGMYTTHDTSIGTVTTAAAALKTYISGGSAVPASINTSCISGGSATSTLSAAAILFTSQICAINSTLASIPASSYTLTWATNFGSTPYYSYTFGFTNSSDTLANQLGKIVSTLGRLKLKLNSSDFVATSDSDGLNVALAAGVRFACSQLSSCSISSLLDVTTSSPGTYHSLFWNGSEFVNKELIFTSTGGTVGITRTDNVGNITINLESFGSSGVATAATLTAGTLTNASVAASLRFPTGSLPRVSKFGKTITIVGSLAVNASGAFAWAHGQSLIMATVPAGYLPLYLPVFNVLILKYTTTSGTSSTVVYQGVCYINGSDLTIELNSPGSPISLTSGESLEIFIGGNSYAAI
jgi:hypothetical protein